MVSFHLTPSQRTHLQALLPQCQDVHLFRRIQALLWLDDGESAPSIARRQFVTEQSIHNWMHRFKEAAEQSLSQRLSDRPRPGRKPRLKSQVEPLVDEILGTPPKATAMPKRVGPLLWCASISKRCRVSMPPRPRCGGLSAKRGIPGKGRAIP